MPQEIMLRQRRIDSGFTLIEVLVALVVIAIGLLAILAVAARSIRVASGLQERVFASWVAGNEITRLRLEPDWPPIGQSNGHVTMAHFHWIWRSSVSGTGVRDLRRVTVRVSRANQPGDTLSHITGFIGRPAPSATGSSQAASADSGGSVQ